MPFPNPSPEFLAAARKAMFDLAIAFRDEINRDDIESCARAKADPDRDKWYPDGVPEPIHYELVHDASEIPEAELAKFVAGGLRCFHHSFYVNPGVDNWSDNCSELLGWDDREGFGKLVDRYSYAIYEADDE